MIDLNEIKITRRFEEFPLTDIDRRKVVALLEAKIPVMVIKQYMSHIPFRIIWGLATNPASFPALRTEEPYLSGQKRLRKARKMLSEGYTFEEITAVSGYPVRIIKDIERRLHSY
ncbi:Uncharacterised protein [Serratia rubidaea]|uniref:Uncharacterized protein n=1 Tax=Serratia rubidaea TaxID=61652 RepID=A0A3S4FVL8_SERRU|nr:Uncharacterised protein [Serratia rubidaea]